MKRKIIKIDSALCNGCGKCATACHEGAIGMVNAKAVLLREDYCDGLGDCLPACPTGAISFEEREAPAYDHEAVMEAKKRSSMQLNNFPIQLKLIAPNAYFLKNADLLIAADCCAYAYAGFHEKFMRDKVTLIGCPKLDGVNYAQKLSEIFENNEINSITIVRMTVPCCGGLPYAVQTALEQAAKNIPIQIITISPDGQIIQ